MSVAQLKKKSQKNKTKTTNFEPSQYYFGLGPQICYIFLWLEGDKS